jgi:prolyl oligopeptidase
MKHSATDGSTRAPSRRRSAKVQGITYPVTRRCDHTDDYHGTIVADPYRWLEDDMSAETALWVQAQNAVTQQFLAPITERAAITEHLTKLWNYEKFGSPFKYGDRTFFYKNTGLQNQYVLFVIDAPGCQPRVLIDPNTLSADGTVSLSGISISEDGKLMAYGLSESGSDWNQWHVRDVATGQDLEDHIKWVKFSSARWLKDSSGFFYSRFDEPKADDVLKGSNFYQKLYFHKLGTSQAEDVLVYERPDEKLWGFGGFVTEDGRYLCISVSFGTSPKNRFFYKDLTKPDSQVVRLIDNFDASYGFIGNEGTKFWFVTDKNAPLRRVIAIDIAKSADDNLSEVELIGEAKETLEDVSLVGNRFFVSYLKDAQSLIREYTLEGAHIRDVKLPGIGSAGGFGGKREDMETYFSFTSYSVPATIYRYDIAKGESEVHFQPKVAFDPSRFVTKQVFYKSKDGTSVPMFITYRKGLKRNGNNATYLYGYGGFGISLGPSFSVNILTWMEMGGIFAEACLRGGGEYGEAWHEAGTKLLKQNVFDDFIAAAEWLIENKYTSSKKLAISGGSNGGLLVGACMTQRPELFAAAVPAVGVLDMLRFHKFTIGHAWTSDYGSSDNADEFAALYAYSPLHNLKEGVAYPATLVMTGDHDDRVVPAHSFKFAAELQRTHKGANPVLIRIEQKAGHGAGKPTAKIIEESADKWGFLTRVLDIPARKLRQLTAR